MIARIARLGVLLSFITIQLTAPGRRAGDIFAGRTRHRSVDILAFPSRRRADVILPSLLQVIYRKELFGD
jgi:hypothetical protein